MSRLIFGNSSMVTVDREAIELLTGEKWREPFILLHGIGGFLYKIEVRMNYL